MTLAHVNTLIAVVAAVVIVIVVIPGAPQTKDDARTTGFSLGMRQVGGNHRECVTRARVCMYVCVLGREAGGGGVLLCVSVCLLRVAHLDQSSYSPCILAVPLRQDQIVVRRPFESLASHIDRSRDPPRGALVSAANSTGVRILPHREFFHFFFFSSPPSCALTRFRVLLVQRIAHGMRHSYFSDLANLRQMDATWPAKSRRLASVTTALAAPLLVIRSYVITLVLLVIDALTSCRSRDNFARGAGEMRHLLARIAPGRCGSGDERRRLYIKIAFKVGKATIPISSV